VYKRGDLFLPLGRDTRLQDYKSSHEGYHCLPSRAGRNVEHWCVNDDKPVNLVAAMVALGELSSGMYSTRSGILCIASDSTSNSFIGLTSGKLSNVDCHRLLMPGGALCCSHCTLALHGEGVQLL
jgi:hypothetical protein